MSSILKIIIIDDEENEIFVLKQKLKTYCSDVEVIATARNIQEGEDLIKTLRPDLVFLDIQMPEGTGFDLLHQFQSIDFGIIFFTSYDEYAMQALDFSALPYLLKPVKIALLQAAIEQFRKEKNNISSQFELVQEIVQVQKTIDRIFLPDKNGLQLVMLDDILYMEANGALTHIYTVRQKRYTVSKQIGQYEKQFSNIDTFFRIHDKYIINANNIIAYNRAESFVTMKNTTQLDISTRRQSDFSQFLKGKGWL